MKIIFLLFLCCFAGIVLVPLIASFIRVRRCRSSWALTMGKVKYFGMNYRIPSICYEYKVNDKVYEGAKFTPGPFANFLKGSATSFPKSFYLTESGQTRFSPGSTHEVFYDPENPSDSALVSSMSPAKGVLLIVPLLAVMAAALLYPQWIVLHQKILFPWVFLIGGLAAFLYGLSWLRRHGQARSFPWVMGHLISAEVITSANSGANGGGSGYTMRVEFEYQVNGLPYRSSQFRELAFWVLQSRRQNVEKQVESLKAETQLKVFYNPNSPSDGFLQHTSLLEALSPMLLGVTFICLGAFLFQRYGH